MARILILEDEPSWNACLKLCLIEYHELTIVNRGESAMKLLRAETFDAVISRVHLKHDDVFRFLAGLKADPELAIIPVICFCGIRSRAANVANSALEKVSRSLGARAYFSLEDFCEGDECDFDALRSAIETAMDRTCI